MIIFIIRKQKAEGEKMEKKVMEFSVNGVNQKIEVKMINEVFEKDGMRTTVSTSGRKVITDRFAPDGKWIHRKIFDKKGNLDSELTRIFDEEGKLISLCEDYDDSKKTTIYEYDDHKNIVHQYAEVLQNDGSVKKCDEFWYKNFYDEKIDETKLEENTICREFKKNQVVKIMEPGIEVRNEYSSENKLSSTTTLKNDEVTSKTSYYKSDDGMVAVTKSENFADRSVYYEISDNRRAEKENCVTVTYMATEKM